MWRHKAIRVLPDIARHWARERPDKIALTDGVSSRTYRQFDERSNQIAHALAGAGIGAGERVGYVGRNSIEFWETWLGANKAGVVFVPLNWRFAIPEFVAHVRANPGKVTWGHNGRGSFNHIAGALIQEVIDVAVIVNALRALRD